MADYILSARQQQGRTYAWDISSSAGHRLITFPVNGGAYPPPIAQVCMDALKTGLMRVGEGHRSKVSEGRVYASR